MAVWIIVTLWVNFFLVCFIDCVVKVFIFWLLFTLYKYWDWACTINPHKIRFREQRPLWIELNTCLLVTLVTVGPSFVSSPFHKKGPSDRTPRQMLLADRPIWLFILADIPLSMSYSSTYQRNSSQLVWLTLNRRISRHGRVDAAFPGEERWLGWCFEGDGVRSEHHHDRRHHRPGSRVSLDAQQPNVDAPQHVTFPEAAAHARVYQLRRRPGLPVLPYLHGGLQQCNPELSFTRTCRDNGDQ